jgi:hypothetical protein
MGLLAGRVLLAQSSRRVRFWSPAKMEWYRYGLLISELDQLVVLDRMEPIVNEPGWPSLLQPF